MKLISAVNSLNQLNVNNDRKIVIEPSFTYLYEYFCFYNQNSVFYLLVLDSGRVRPFSVTSVEMCQNYFYCCMRRNKKSLKDRIFNKKKFDNDYYKNKIERSAYKVYIKLLDTEERAHLNCCDSFVNEFKIFLDEECTAEIYL